MSEALVVSETFSPQARKNSTIDLRWDWDALKSLRGS